MIDLCQIEGVKAIGESRLFLEVLIPSSRAKINVHFVPKHLVNPSSQVQKRGDHGALIIPLWLATQKGIHV